MIDPHVTMIIKIGTIAVIIETDINLAGWDPIPAIIDTGATVEVIHEGVAPGHITDPHTAAHPATETQAHIAINETLHIEDPHHTEIFFRNCSRFRPCTSHKNNHPTSSKPSYSSNRTAWEKQG